MRESFSGVLLEWIETGRLDLAVLYDARRGANILATPLLLEDLFLIEAPGSATSGPVEMGELGARACLLPGPDNGLRRVVDAACGSEHVQPVVQMEIDCVAALKQLVERGRLRARPFRSPAMRAMLVIATPPANR